MSQLIGLDFETYSAVNLPKHGLSRYVNDKTFRVLLAGLAWYDGVSFTPARDRLDFVGDWNGSKRELERMIGGHTIVAHNAEFESRVLNKLGLVYPLSRFVDSAVVARAAGAGGHLEAAGPQLLGIDKIEAGRDLMKLFSMPGEYQERSGRGDFDPQVVKDHPVEWVQYGEYCEVDAMIGLELANGYDRMLTPEEMGNQAITMAMNNIGWPVDIAKVEEMHRRYLENQELALQEFRSTEDAADLNLNSLKQLKEWCAARGVKANSFDEAHVASLIKRIDAKLAAGVISNVKAKEYKQVLHLLHTKQVLGGSSLKKLQVILDTAMPDAWRPGTHRLRDQYMHVGAGQSWRTTGRSTQMQNLKRLSVVADMDELDDPSVDWDNAKLAENMRQLFTASDPNGVLIVGDFKSVESRGLAWAAGEQWKLDAYRQGLGVYEMQASKIYGVPYEFVLPGQRTGGKLAELSCGYGAGGVAVQDFAAGMGIEMSEGESTKLVWDWRDANPDTVAFWDKLNEALHAVVVGGKSISTIELPDNLWLKFHAVQTPASLLNQRPGVVSIGMSIVEADGRSLMKRYFLGCYAAGGNIRYHRPSDRKTGNLWREGYVNPKTKQFKHYELYGGKLAGIFTQSLCREIFFNSLKQVHMWCRDTGSVDLIGQFHDEIVVDFRPGQLSLEGATADIRRMMSDPGRFTSFPLGADVKYSYRYTK